MRLKPCKVCKSTKIKLWDCGYSSFNPGGGECHRGHKIQSEAGCMPTQNDLARIWNTGQRLTSEERLRVKYKKLRREFVSYRAGTGGSVTP